MFCVQLSRVISSLTCIQRCFDSTFLYRTENRLGSAAHEWFVNGISGQIVGRLEDDVDIVQLNVIPLLGRLGGRHLGLCR